MEPGQRPAAGAALQLRSRIPNHAAGTTLLDYLLQRFRYHDRAQWLGEFAQGRLRLAGVVATPGTRLRGGEQLVYEKVHEEPWVARDVRIVHRAPAYTIVEKPAHLPMHADGPFLRHTLVHLLRSGPLPDAEIVHRLDRETSGLCVVANTKAARAAFERQFRDATVTKDYIAIARGVVAADFTVAAPIGHCPRSAIALRRSAAPDAVEPRDAHTDFVVVDRGPCATLLRCLPHTGRTHQIRVHLEHAGHPLLGDKLYGRPDSDYLDFVARVKAGGDGRSVADGEPDRQLLHASRLGFTDPDSGARVDFHSAPPDDFVAWLRRS